MSKFIKVTQKENGKPLLINTDKLAVVGSKEGGVQLHLTELGNTLHVIAVVEKIEDVQKLLKCARL